MVGSTCPTGSGNRATTVVDPGATVVVFVVYIFLTRDNNMRELWGKCGDSSALWA